MTSENLQYLPIILDLFARARYNPRMAERICQECVKFAIEEKPDSIRYWEKSIFFDEYGAEKELSPLGMLLGVSSSLSDYGQRRCSYPGAGLGAQPCKKPNEFEPRG